MTDPRYKAVQRNALVILAVLVGLLVAYLGARDYEEDLIRQAIRDEVGLYAPADEWEALGLCLGLMFVQDADGGLIRSAAHEYVTTRPVGVMSQDAVAEVMAEELSGELASACNER